MPADPMRPTAANIIASLGVKGASMIGGSAAYAKYLPVLDANGKLDVSVIPAGGSSIPLEPLANAKVVDASYSGSSSNGSVAAPFKTITEAATAGAQAILLMPGSYAAFGASFQSEHVAIIGVGQCSLTGLGIVSSAYSNWNIVGQGIEAKSIRISGVATVTCLANTRLEQLIKGGQSLTLYLSDDSRVISTDANDIYFLAETSRIANTSTVKGGTAEAALTRLGDRKIRIAYISTDSSGFVVASSSDIAASGDSVDVHDLRSYTHRLVSALNARIGTGGEITTDTIRAEHVIANTVEANQVSASGIGLQGGIVYIDDAGYLMVGDNGAWQAPSTRLLIMDSVTSEIYGIGVANGRAFIEPADDSADSSSGPVPTELFATDEDTGEVYRVTVENGQLILSGTIGAEASV